MTCPEKRVLQDRCTTSSHVYAESLAFLSAKVGTVSKQEYERLHSIMLHFRKQLEMARIELEKHKTEHGCGDDPKAMAATNAN